MAKTGKTSPEGVYTVPWGIYGDTNGKKDNYDEAANNCKGIINDATKIYVVDVNSASPSTLLDKATEKVQATEKFKGATMYQLIQSITRFSADTAMKILSGMDAATSWNPATDLNATDGGAFYDQFVAKRNDLVQDFDTAVAMPLTILRAWMSRAILNWTRIWTPPLPSAKPIWTPMTM